MQRRGAPLRMIAPGRVFRRDTPDPTHNPMFFQVEGLCVDRGISMAHLKGTVAEFLRRMFGEQTVTRFRPSYFPFTEPSAEFDFSCFKCGGSGCRICKNSGWIELGGSGMVHPNVLRGAGVDPEEFSGFAFGLGIDRMVRARCTASTIFVCFSRTMCDFWSNLINGVNSEVVNGLSEPTAFYAFTIHHLRFASILCLSVTTGYASLPARP